MPDIIQQLLDLKEWSQDSARYERRMNFRAGQLVQPGPGRQGYAAVKKQGVQPGPGRTGKGIYNPSLSERGQKIIKATKEYNNLVLKDFNKGNLTNTETFAQFAGKKYGHQLVKSQGDMALKYPEVEEFKIKRLDATRDKLFKKLINEANQGEQFVDFPSIAKKISKTAPIVHTSAAYRKLLDTKSDKVKKVFNNMVKNDEPLHLIGKGHGPLWDANPLLKIISQRSGVKSAPSMREALDTDPFYKKNKKLIKFAADARLMDYGKPLSEILEQADYRIGGGVQWSYGTGKRPAKDVAETINDFALKHWNQHKRNKTGNSQIEFYSKKNNKPISWEKVSKSPRTGIKSLISTDVYFKYKNDPKQRKWSLGELRKSGREAGIFDEVYKTRYSYQNMMNKMVTNPVNPTGRKIRFGQLMSKVFKEGFDDASSPYAIDHIKGVAHSPFNDLRLASTRTNLALSYINKHVPQKNFKKTLVSELMGGATDFKSKQYVKDLVKQGEGLAKEVLVGGKKVPISSVQEVGGKFLKPSKFKTLTGPQKKIAQRMAKAETYKIFNAFQANGIGDGCPIDGKAEGGRIGYFKGGSDQCMRNAINEHKRKLADGNEVAINKQIQINKTKPMKNILNLGSRGLRGLTSIVGGWGGAAIEAAVEAGFYGYGRQQGESHEQARENLFLPKILAKYAPDLWEKFGEKPFKTGVWEGPEKLIEEELLAGNESAQEYAQGIKALEDEYANASKIDFELGIMKNPRRPAAPEDIEIKEQELRDSYGRIEELQINIKEGTPAHDAYVAAQEKQKALRDERAQDYYGDSPAYRGSKQRQWQEEFLDYRGADRKYRKEQPFAFKGGIEANIGPTKEESEKGMRIPWEEVFPRTIDTPRTTEQQKWDYIMNQGGWDLMDKISAAGGVANMAGGGIASLLKKK